MGRMHSSSSKDLASNHLPETLRKRLFAKKKFNYLGDAILGAIDGCITTFAVVAGVSGGDLSANVALLLGSANILGDGFSMAVSNYQRAKSEKGLIEKARRTEEHHIDYVPEGEKEEIRQIFAQKGFPEPLLGEIVNVITSNRGLWINTMIQEEFGLPLEAPSPWKAGLTTFLAFILIGAIPLLPFVLLHPTSSFSFLMSTLFTGITFLGIGLLKGKILNRPLLRSSLETLWIGAIAAGLAYGITLFLRRIT